MPIPQADTPTNAAAPRGNEITLREAEQLSRRSERTLRRKLEAGELRGRKVQLDNGSPAWLVDVASLHELYPDIAADGRQVPTGGGVPTDPMGGEKPAGDGSASADPLGGSGSAVPPPPAADEAAPDQKNFFGYLFDENRTLKRRVQTLQDELTETKHAAGKWEGEAQAAERFKQQILDQVGVLQAKYLEAERRLALMEINPSQDRREAGQGRDPNVIEVEAIPVARRSTRVLLWILVLIVVAGGGTALTLWLRSQGLL